MPGVREFFDTPAGKGVAGVFLLAAIGAAAYAILYGNASGGEIANGRMYVDATTGKPYAHELEIGEKVPVKSPSGLTGYPAEECYWTKDGKVKTTPTYVLLNSLVGKPEPTFCPDCGRLVVGHNPPPTNPNAKAPPTQAEYAASGR